MICLDTLTLSDVLWKCTWISPPVDACDTARESNGCTLDFQHETTISDKKRWKDENKPLPQVTTTKALTVDLPQSSTGDVFRIKQYVTVVQRTVSTVKAYIYF